MGADAGGGGGGKASFPGFLLSGEKKATTLYFLSPANLIDGCAFSDQAAGRMKVCWMYQGDEWVEAM